VVDHINLFIMFSRIQY